MLPVTSSWMHIIQQAHSSSLSLNHKNPWYLPEHIANVLDTWCKGQWDPESLSNHGWIQMSCTLLHEAVKTYASCVYQSLMKMFFVIAAIQNKIISIADTTNAFQQSPLPKNMISRN